MSDNVEIGAQSGGALIAADDIGNGVKVQRVKIGYGADGAFTDVATGTPLPAFVLSGVGVGSERVTVAVPGAAVPLPAQPQICGLTVRARLANVGTVYVGGPDVTAANGFELAPGEALSVDVADSAAVYVDADTAGDGVCLLWVSA